jgi:integrase
MRITYTVGNAQAKFIRMKSTSRKRSPSIVNLTVKRHYLTQREIERLILVAYRHGLRASEVRDLQWQQVDPKDAASTLPNVLVASSLSIACCGGGNGRVGRLQNEVGTLAFGRR